MMLLNKFMNPTSELAKRREAGGDIFKGLNPGEYFNPQGQIVGPADRPEIDPAVRTTIEPKSEVTVLSSKDARNAVLKDRNDLQQFGDQLTLARQQAESIKTGIDNLSNQQTSQQSQPTVTKNVVVPKRTGMGITDSQAAELGIDMNLLERDQQTGELFYKPPTGQKVEDNPLYTDALKAYESASASLKEEAAKVKEKIARDEYDPATTALIDDINSEMDLRIADQQAINDSELAYLQTRGLRRDNGSARYAGEVNKGILSSKETKNLEAIDKIKNEKRRLIAAAKAAERDKDYSRLNDIMDKVREADINAKNKAVEFHKQIIEEGQKRREEARTTQAAIRDQLKFETEQENTTISSLTDLIAKNLTGDSEKDAALIEGFALQNGVDSAKLESAVLKRQGEIEKESRVPGKLGEYQAAIQEGVIPDGTTLEEFLTALDPAYQYAGENARLGIAEKKASIAKSYSDIENSKGVSEYKPFQYTAANYATRLEQSNSIISNLEGEVTKYSAKDQYVQNKLPNVLKKDEFRQIEQAQRNFINAVLRRESGSAIAASEFESAAKQYFPQPGDDAKTLEQKRANRSLVLENFKNEAGPAYRPTVDLINGQTFSPGQVIVRDDGTKARVEADGTVTIIQ